MAGQEEPKGKKRDGRVGGDISVGGSGTGSALAKGERISPPQ
jgi:hypothetical protein